MISQRNDRPLPYDHLLGSELDKAHAAADALLTLAEVLKLEPALRAKLSTLRSDLSAEQEDRRRIASSPDLSAGRK